MDVSLAETQISIGGVETVKEKKGGGGGGERQLQLWDRTSDNNVDVKLTE